MNKFIGPKNNIHIFAEPLLINQLQRIITTAKDEGRVEGLLAGMAIATLAVWIVLEVTK